MEKVKKSSSNTNAMISVKPANGHTGQARRVRRRKPLVIGILIGAGVLAIISAITAVILLSQRGHNKGAVFGETDDVVQVATGDNEIDLSKYTKSVRIKEAGEYTLSGTLTNHSVIVDAESDVTLVLNNATIETDNTAAIANLSEYDLYIALADGTTNTIKDGGSSEYNAALYSVGALIVNGNDGILNVTGQQKDGRGIGAKSTLTMDGGNVNVKSLGDGLAGKMVSINYGTVSISSDGDGIKSDEDTVLNGGMIYVAESGANKRAEKSDEENSENGDENAEIEVAKGYTVHGGTLVMLGSEGTLETPTDNSTQCIVAWDFPTTYKTGANIRLVDIYGNILIEYNANEDFRTLILSNDLITEENNYTLYIDGQAIQSVDISSTITVVGDANVTE